VPPWRRRAPADLAIGACFALATVLTFVPWTRFGSGSGFAGAWAADPRWSMLAAIAAPAGLAVWVFARRIGRAAAPIEAVLGALLVVGAVMAFRNPPSYKRPSVAPLLMMATGGLAAALALARRHPLAYGREPTGGTP
jgi:hypothetical protein